mgnify:FL=1
MYELHTCLRARLRASSKPKGPAQHLLFRHFLEELRITLTRAVSDERLPYTLRSVCLTAVNLTALYQVQNVMRMNNDRQVFNENGET